MVTLWNGVRALLAGRAALIVENLALRHQLAVLQRSVKRPRLRRRDRVLGLVVQNLGKLAIRPFHRQDGHRRGLAPPGLPTLPALEEPAPW